MEGLGEQVRCLELWPDSSGPALVVCGGPGPLMLTPESSGCATLERPGPPCLGRQDDVAGGQGAPWEARPGSLALPSLSILAVFE